MIVIINKGGMDCILSIVYGHNIVANKADLWQDLITLSPSLEELPWTVIGDFNVVRYSDEMIGGCPLQSAALLPLNNCTSHRSFQI